MKLPLVAAIATTAVLGSGALPAWAQTDRGQPGTAADQLALGPDVGKTVGAPSGPPVRGAELTRRTEALSAHMRCPVCQGHAIVDSPSESARNMKRQVRAMIAAGFSDEQVLRYFEARYGEFIRLVPRAAGFNLLVWIIPLSGMVFGLLLVVMRMRRRGAESGAEGQAVAEQQSASADADPNLDPWIARVREEISRSDG